MIVFEVRLGCERRWCVPEPQRLHSRDMILDRTNTATASQLAGAGGYPGWFPIEPALIEVLPQDIWNWLDSRAIGWRMFDRALYPSGTDECVCDTILAFRSEAVGVYFSRRFARYLKERELAQLEYLCDLADAIAETSFHWLTVAPTKHRYRRAKSFLSAERHARGRRQVFEAAQRTFQSL
jgi:hypothetical protein